MIHMGKKMSLELNTSSKKCCQHTTEPVLGIKSVTVDKRVHPMDHKEMGEKGKYTIGEIRGIRKEWEQLGRSVVILYKVGEERHTEK